MPLCIVVEGMRHETNAVGIKLGHLYERLHDTVGNYGHRLRAAIFHQMQTDETAVQERLYLQDIPLHEYQAGNGGYFLALHMRFTPLVYNGTVNKCTKLFLQNLVYHIDF